MSNPIIKIHRVFQDKNQTSGFCGIFIDGFPMFSAVSLERGWQDNQTNVSCVPMGTYKLVLEYSARFNKMLWELKGVPSRSEAKFHASNFWHQLNGCIALGRKYKKIDTDGYLDVTNSGPTMDIFHSVLKKYKEATLIIEGDEGLF